MIINEAMLTNFVVKLDLTKEDREIITELSNIFNYGLTNELLMRRLIDSDLYLFSNQMIHLSSKKLSQDIMLSILGINHIELFSCIYFLSKEQIKIYLLLNNLQNMQMSEYINQLLNSNQLKDITNDSGTA